MLGKLFGKIHKGVKKIGGGVNKAVKKSVTGVGKGVGKIAKPGGIGPSDNVIGKLSSNPNTMRAAMKVGAAASKIRARR